MLIMYENMMCLEIWWYSAAKRVQYLRQVIKASARMMVKDG